MSDHSDNSHTDDIHFVIHTQHEPSDLLLRFAPVLAEPDYSTLQLSSHDFLRCVELGWNTLACERLFVLDPARLNPMASLQSDMHLGPCTTDAGGWIVDPCMKSRHETEWRMGDVEVMQKHTRITLEIDKAWGDLTKLREAMGTGESLTVRQSAGARTRSSRSNMGATAQVEGLGGEYFYERQMHTAMTGDGTYTLPESMEHLLGIITVPLKGEVMLGEHRLAKLTKGSVPITFKVQLCEVQSGRADGETP